MTSDMERTCFYVLSDFEGAVDEIKPKPKPKESKNWADDTNITRFPLR